MTKDKMNLKEFFKPDMSKIILTLVMIIITIIFWFLAKVNVLCKMGVPCPPVNHFIRISEISGPRFISANYIYLILELLISYLISCFIIFIFNKFKEKKKK